MKCTLQITALALSLSALSSAFAADGYLIDSVSLRAGPDMSYPRVVMLPSGAEVAIEGCIDGWSWCDVAVGNDRGWVAGNFLQEEYQGQRVLVPEYGVRIGIPVVSFVFGTYWNENYRNRSWYGNRERWSHITPRYDTARVHDDRRDHQREDTNPHPRNTSVEASRAPAHTAGTVARQHELIASHPSETRSRSAVQQRAVVSQTAQEKNVRASKSSTPHVMNPNTSTSRSVAMHNAPQSKVGAAQKPAVAKATRKPVAQQDAPERQDKSGKDEH